MEKTLDFTKLKPANYHRKSTEGEDRQMLSLSSQEDECNNIAEYYKLKTPFIKFQDAKSAKEAGLRPQFNEMMQKIFKGEINAIVCWHINRLARNMTEGGILIDLLGAGKLVVITPTEVYDENSDAGILSYHFGASKQYSKNLSRDVKRGQFKKARMGVPHGVATLGFLNDKSEEKGNRKWLVDQVRLPLIEILLKKFLTGTYSAGKLHKYAVEELKLTTVPRKKTGGELIVLSRMYEILKDPIYAGFFFYGGERFELDKSLPRLITEAEHNKIKMILSKAHIPKVQHHQTTYSGFISSHDEGTIGQDVKFQVICDCKHKFAYRSKTHCPSCGVEIDKMEHPKYLSYIWHYNVKAKKAGETYKSIASSDIDVYMANFALENLQFSPELVEWSKKHIHELKGQEAVEKVAMSRNREARKQEFEEKKAKLRAMYRDGKFTEEEYNEDLRRLNESYADVTVSDEETVDWYARMMEITDITSTIAGVFTEDDVEAKRTMLSKLGSNLVWNNEELKIYNDIAIEKLIEGIKRAKAVNPKFEPKNYVVDKGSNEKTEPKDPVFSIMLRR
ncbi:recombinase family protein [Candidatus Kaiserbacteria bacterium]|nr:recombinase family protein [Candidatus Kaiserbacteria bacterium]USN91941.1 MAG: recombinase family protein [Candidatus Nomurabacteria bacterium]